MKRVHTLTTNAALILVAVLGLAAGCGSRTAECAYLCQRAATCVDTTDPVVCAAACVAYGTTAGLSGRRAISQCASCLADATCTEIGRGACDAECAVPGVELAEPGAVAPVGSGS
jgi:hypothetical protein